MNLYTNAASFTASFIFLVLMTLFLRYRGVISKSDAPLIARLTVDFVLPALLVSKLIFIQLSSQVLFISSLIILAECLVGMTAYLIGRFLLKLPRPSLGVFILCCTFGSTAILGTAFISAIFDQDKSAVAYSLVISQISTGVPAYIIFPLVSSYFGESSTGKETAGERFRKILFSPTVLAIIFGLGWGALGLPTHGAIITPLVNAANFVGLGLVLMVALLNGLSLERIPLRQNIGPVVCCVLCLLLTEPMLVYSFGKFFDIPLRDRQISFVLSGMPSANSTIAFAIRYKCDAKLAAILVTSTAVVAAFSLPTLMANLSIFSQ
jgi:predicted permease